MFLLMFSICDHRKMESERGAEAPQPKSLLDGEVRVFDVVIAILGLRFSLLLFIFFLTLTPPNLAEIANLWLMVVLQTTK